MADGINPPAPAPKRRGRPPGSKSTTTSPAKPVAKRAAPLKAGPTQPAPAAKPASTTRARASGAASAIRQEAGTLKDQASASARGAATEGKARAASALGNVARLIGDAAGTVDEKVGAQYGDYARKAADSVNGFAATLRDKDVDDLVRDATDFVKKSPAVAIGAAAAIGFVLARLIRAGTDSDGKA
jgi:ElaB/YqjD/DUF883 family membrane-anchored ribosome-binding protein